MGIGGSTQRAICLLILLFHPEDGGNALLRDVANHIPVFTATHHRIGHFWWSLSVLAVGCQCSEVLSLWALPLSHIGMWRLGRMEGGFCYPRHNGNLLCWLFNDAAAILTIQRRMAGRLIRWNRFWSSRCLIEIFSRHLLEATEVNNGNLSYDNGYLARIRNEHLPNTGRHEAGRSPILFPITSLDFFSCPNPCSRTRPWVYSASNRNEYQETSWEIKNGRRVRPTTSPPFGSRVR
jgi:hypothetical protein